MPIQYHYGAFPPKNIQWEKLTPVLDRGIGAIARYDGLLNTIQNSDMALSLLLTNEAVSSSRLEGIQVTIEDIFEYEAGSDPEKYTTNMIFDMNEIILYGIVLLDSEELIKKFPLSQRLLKDRHKMLLNTVRGKNKKKGEYRKIPNWIGPMGCSIENASYIPISPDKLNSGMDEWEKFIYADYPNKLVQLALLHAEFESLHPFLDGNGMLGRMFVPLFLWQKNIFSKPVFYISSVFEKDRANYYSHLRDVSATGAWTEWCIYFLQSIIKQSEENIRKVKYIIQLYNDMKISIPKIIGSQYAPEIIDSIFINPGFRGSFFARKSKIPIATVRHIADLLVQNNILTVLEEGKGRRSSVYMFPELIKRVSL